MTTPPRADLHTLAAEAIDGVLDANGWMQGDPFPVPEDLVDAVLAAVLPEHRRMVLAEAAEALRQVEDGRNEYATSAPDGTAAFLRHEATCFGTAAKIVEGDLTPLYGLLPSWRWTDAMHLAATAPPATLSARVPAEPAPPVPEDYPFAQIGRQAVESVLALGDALAKAYGPSLAALGQALALAVPEGADGQRATEGEPDADFDFGTGGSHVIPSGLTIRWVPTGGYVPLADVLNALRDTRGFETWAHATGRPSCYLDEVTPNSDELAEYLTARFAPTAPEGADERNGHG